jgi:quercetin dioxygenase-like cupin family protein
MTKQRHRWRPRHHFTDNSAMPTEPVPLHVEPASDPVDRDIETLLSEPFASAWAAGDAAAAAAPSGRLRSRLLGRVSASQAASAATVNARPKRLPAAVLAPGVSARTLYAAPQGRALRPGEPLCARRVEMQAGSRWPGAQAGSHREWLVLRGSAHIGGELLQLRDYLVTPAAVASGEVVAGDDGAWLFLRESTLEARPGEVAHTVRDADAGWPEFAPGLRRRVLWQRDGQAAMLYHVDPKTTVPHHSHGHDEECLMLQGEFFLDDILLQEGDYQLAPAGTGHRITETATGVVIYAHGDLDLKFVG